MSYTEESQTEGGSESTGASVANVISTAETLSESVRELVRDAAEGKKNEAAAAARQIGETIAAQDPAELANAWTHIRELWDKAEDHIRNNPFQAIGIALGTGFLLGLRKR